MYPATPDRGRDFPHYPAEAAAEWRLVLALAGSAPNDERHILPPVANGYAIRLVIGASDGAARTFEVDLDWDSAAPTAASALHSVFDHLAVRGV
jgi:hypothetical protein